MSKYLIESLGQKFELRSSKVFFDLKDSLLAEEILDRVDRASAGLGQVFDLTSEVEAQIYLYPNSQVIERVTQRPLAMGETIRVVPEDNVLLVNAGTPPPQCGEEVVRQVSLMIFNRGVKEREIGIMQWRTPSWLREGICSQVPWKIRTDSKDFLVKAWNQLQEAQKAEQLIRPGVMAKNIGMIPDPNRRALAFHQSFYMFRLLSSTYCDKFFKRYSTLMGALEDMEAETAFRQITSFDFEKFFHLFKEWVRVTNAFVAME